MSWKTRGCYVWRTRKPHSLLGFGLRFWVPMAVGVACLLAALDGPWWLSPVLLMFSGRHTAYVGQTGSRHFRDQQHLYGDQRYGAMGKPWSDLEPRVYALPCFFPGSKWGREFTEGLWIVLLLPIYNVQGNGKNPRRIKPATALRQRKAREAARRSFEGWLMMATVVVTRVCFGLLLLGAVGYGVWVTW